MSIDLPCRSPFLPLEMGAVEYRIWAYDTTMAAPKLPCDQLLTFSGNYKAGDNRILHPDVEGGKIRGELGESREII